MAEHWDVAPETRVRLPSAAHFAQLEIAKVKMLKRLQARHLQILEFNLMGLGASEISKRLSLSHYGVSQIMNSPLFQQEISRRRAAESGENTLARQEVLVNARSKLENAAEAAVETQIGLLKSKDERVQLASAKTILDRCFTGDEHGKTSVNLNVESITVLRLAIQESRGESPPKVIEAKEIQSVPA